MTTPLSLRERLSYGFGDLAFSLAYNMVSGTLLFYYINVIGLPPGPVATIFLIARILDAVIDILVGVAVDRTRTRWGRTRPYFLFMAIPYAAVSVAIYAMPDWSQTAQLAYAFVTFKALGILMSIGSIPYTALMPMMTGDPKDRLKLSGMRSIGTSVSVILGTAAVQPILSLFGGERAAQGYLVAALLFAGLSLVAIIALFRNCRERIVEDKAAVPILPVVAQMLHNRAWWVAFGSCFFYFVRFGGMMAVTFNMAIDVLQKPWMIGIMLPCVAGTLLLSSFIAPAILARTGIRFGAMGAVLVAAALFLLLPLCEGLPLLFLTIYFFACLATSITITAAFTMIAETVDYHEWKFGSRNEGLLSAGISLATKLGMALGTAGIGYMLAVSNYRPDAVTDAARDAISWTYYGGTVALLLIQAVIFNYWPMDGQRKATP